MGTAGTVLPYGHCPHQPLRYASPLPAPCSRPQGRRVGLPAYRRKSLAWATPSLVGRRTMMSFQAWLLLLSLGRPCPPLGFGLFQMMQGLAGTRLPAPSSLHLHPKEAAWAAFRSPGARGGNTPLLSDSSKTRARCEIHSLVAVATSVTF